MDDSRHGDWFNDRRSWQETVTYYQATKKCLNSTFSGDLIEIRNDLEFAQTVSHKRIQGDA